MKGMSKLVKVSLCVCEFVVPGAIWTGLISTTTDLAIHNWNQMWAKVSPPLSNI